MNAFENDEGGGMQAELLMISVNNDLSRLLEQPDIKNAARLAGNVFAGDRDVLFGHGELVGPCESLLASFSPYYRIDETADLKQHLGLALRRGLLWYLVRQRAGEEVGVEVESYKGALLFLKGFGGDRGAMMTALQSLVELGKGDLGENIEGKKARARAEHRLSWPLYWRRIESFRKAQLDWMEQVSQTVSGVDDWGGN